MLMPAQCGSEAAPIHQCRVSPSRDTSLAALARLHAEVSRGGVRSYNVQTSKWRALTLPRAHTAFDDAKRVLRSRVVMLVLVSWLCIVFV